MLFRSTPAGLEVLHAEGAVSPEEGMKGRKKGREEERMRENGGWRERKKKRERERWKAGKKAIKKKICPQTKLCIVLCES